MIDLSQGTTAGRRDLQEIIDLYVTSFLLWKQKTSRRRAQAIGEAFPVWWILRGPTAFRTNEDAALMRAVILHQAEERSAPIETESAESLPTPDEGEEV